MHPTVKFFFHKESSTATYVVYDPASKDAVLIDPVMDLDTMNWQCSVQFNELVAAFIDQEGLKLRFILDSHTHADHITGAAWFKDKYKAPYCIGERITLVQKTFAGLFNINFRCDGSQFDRLLKANEIVEAGTLRIKCILTNGHTPNCMSYLIGDALFTGDTLFMEDFGTGRCDFPGGSAEDLYASITKLYKELPSSTRVFVGHDYQPNGRPLKVETTLEIVKSKSIHLTDKTPKGEFIQRRTTRDVTLPLPKMIFPALLVNMNGGRLPEPENNGMRYLKIPLNLRQKTNDVGVASKL